VARNLGQTRVFGHAGRDTAIVGLRRRVLSDLYHRLVTGGWLQLCLVYAVVYLLTGALLEVAHWALAAGALSAVDGFVRWAELVIGAGIVMAKFSTQKALVLFSEVAAVAPHERGQALLFRMANQRRGHVVDARVSLLLVRNEREPDGEVVRRAHDLPLLRGGTALFEHAWTAVHQIDEASPLHGETADSLAAADAELLVTFSGYDERLLRPIHARHVYPSRRVRWGVRFASIETVLPDGRRALDYRRFHEVVPVEDTEAEAARPRRERAG